MAFTFRTAFKKLVPWWLSTGEGGLVLHTMGIIKDAFVDRAYYGSLYRLPEYAPSDALALIGQARRMRRGAGESDAAYARRLTQWRQFHLTNGNPFSLLRQIRQYAGDVRVRTVDASGNWYTIDVGGAHSYQWGLENWLWDNAPVMPEEEWARFWVIIYSTGASAPWRKQRPIGTGVFGESGVTIGTTATPADVAAIRAIVADVVAHANVDTVIIAFDDSTFDPTAPEPDGDWGSYATNISGVQTRTRESTARYWDW